jgi:hypothetical protein
MSGTATFTGEAALSSADTKSLVELAGAAGVTANGRVLETLIELVALGVKARDLLTVLTAFSRGQ